MVEEVKLVLVTGSGRSGTSSVAGTLKRLGLYIPQPEVDADEKNTRGYYEPLWVTEFHKQLLNPLPVRTIDARPEVAEVAAAAVTREVEQELRAWLSEQLDHHQVLIKDPRAFWVHDLWLKVSGQLGAELTTLTMLRHPTEVVRSRDSAYLSEQSETLRLQRETANIAAWVNAAFVTERVTRVHERAFVRYADLIEDWRTAIGRAGDQLELTFDTDLTSNEQHPIDDFIDAKLNRSQITWDDLAVAPQLRDLAEHTWGAMNRLVDDPGDATVSAELTQLRQEYVAMYEAAAALVSDQTAAEVAAVRRAMRAKIEAKQRHLDASQEKLQAAKAKLADSTAAHRPANQAKAWLDRITGRAER